MKVEKKVFHYVEKMKFIFIFTIKKMDITDTTYSQWGGLIETMYSQFSEKDLLASENKKIVHLRKKLKKLEKARDFYETRYILLHLGITQKIKKYLASPLLDEILECVQSEEIGNLSYKIDKLYPKAKNFFNNQWHNSEEYGGFLYGDFSEDYKKKIKAFSKEKLRYHLIRHIRFDDFVCILTLVECGAPTVITPTYYEAKDIAHFIRVHDKPERLSYIYKKCGVTIKLDKILEYLYTINCFSLATKIKNCFNENYEYVYPSFFPR